MNNTKGDNEIVEKKLGISPDYQYKALRTANFLQSNWHANKYIALENCLTLNKKIAVLDLGTGSGNFELLFARRLKSITGLDYHREALEFLDSKLYESKINNVRLVHGDIRRLDKIKNLGKFDLIILIDVIEHIKVSDAAKMIAGFKKILNPGGNICIITPNYHSLWVYIERILDKLTIVPLFDGQQHLAKYYPDNLTEIFARNGFTKSVIKSFNLFSYVIPTKMLSAIFCKLELSSNLTFGNLLLGVFHYKKHE